MNIYCLSLGRSSERRAMMESLFKDEVIIYIDAVDGLDFATKSDPSGSTWKKTSRARLVQEGILDEVSKLSPTQAACNLSHFSALEAFLKTEEEFCIVLEDDVMPTEVLSRAWKNGKSLESFVEFPAGCDMLYLCDSGECRNVIQLADSEGRIKQAFTLMAYAITRKGAKTCLSVGKPTRWLLDYQFPVSCYPKHKFPKELLPDRLKGMPSIDARAFVSGGPIKHSELAQISFLGHDVNNRLHPTSVDRRINIRRREHLDSIEASRSIHEEMFGIVRNRRQVTKYRKGSTHGRTNE